MAQLPWSTPEAMPRLRAGQFSMASVAPEAHSAPMAKPNSVRSTSTQANERRERDRAVAEREGDHREHQRELAAPAIGGGAGGARRRAGGAAG